MRRILVLVMVGLFSCKGQTILEKHISPTDDYVLQVVLGDRNDPADKHIISLRLMDRNDNELDYLRTRANNVMKWAVTWYSDNTIIMDSHDVGTYGWVVENEHLIPMNEISSDMEDKCIETFKAKFGTHGIHH